MQYSRWNEANGLYVSRFLCVCMQLPMHSFISCGRFYGWCGLFHLDSIRSLLFSLWKRIFRHCRFLFDTVLSLMLNMSAICFHIHMFFYAVWILKTLVTTIVYPEWERQQEKNKCTKEMGEIRHNKRIWKFNIENKPIFLMRLKCISCPMKIISQDSKK